MKPIEIAAEEVVSIDDPLAPGVIGLRVAIANVFAVSSAQGWTLIDAGLWGFAGRIERWAAAHMADRAPDAIVLTHGHFDHVGAIDALLEKWDVPVYAHALELPYLTGQGGYPPPDPTVGGGLMARLAAAYPHDPIDLGKRVRPLPADGVVPTLPEWRAVHTPGHSAGHVSLFRPADRTLIVGDAFCTTRQEAFLAVAAQTPELHGPPAYFTTEWDLARESVRALAALRPLVVAPGHGRPMAGPRLAEALDELAARFDEVARPAHGRYVNRPTTG